MYLRVEQFIESFFNITAQLLEALITFQKEKEKATCKEIKSISKILTINPS